ncbi:hypothetical protein JYJ93_09850 [Corallococcus sp. NCSPR001]|uniref:hypothetical protein n=1 Tax=Corallococcus sp. NCSPR001 TaxID=2813576 RepID=UPI001A8BF521|nr:hypothetical protein [Corallococcus sp. NCSPR001]MBN9682729.1 hypothetical protein [Corallococcus sp. NCSPR001]
MSHWKALPGSSVKMGDATREGSGSVLPDKQAFCQDVKAVVRTVGKGFKPLRGQAQRGNTEELSIWESTKNIQDLRCSVYQTRVLGDYVYCVQTNQECSPAQDRFHLLSSYLMSTCYPGWSWQDSRLDSWDTYSQRRMVMATNEEGLRISLEMGRAKDSYSRCDVTLTFELL